MKPAKSQFPHLKLGPPMYGWNEEMEHGLGPWKPAGPKSGIKDYDY